MEIVHLSFGPRSNYLNTLFYNDQESYFVYSDADLADSRVDPAPRFKAGKEYTPRALFWDLCGGFGSLERVSSVYEPKDEESSAAAKVPVLHTGYSAEKSWTDSLRVKLHPKYRQELQNWHVGETFDGKAKGSRDHQFLGFKEGRDEFETFGDEYVDEVVRPLFEACDNLAGVSLATDISGWAGLSDRVLETLRDDYIPKTTVVSWALSENQRARPYLESFLSLTEYSDLVVPLGTRSGTPWERAEQQNLVYETVGIMSSLRTNRVSMSTLVDDLTGNAPDCKIVQAKATTQQPTGDFFVPFKTEVYDARLEVARRKDPKVRARVVLERPKKLELTVPADSVVYECPQPGPRPLRAELAMTSDPVELRKLVRPWQHELRERVHEMTEPYIWGYDSDSE